MAQKFVRLLPAVCVSAALLGSAPPAAAQISVEVNGQPVRFEAVAAQKIGGRVFIPLRAVSEALGAEIEWNPISRVVRGRKGEREFSLPIGSASATVNGAPVRLDQPAQIAFGTTMVPLRFVAEALGAEVEWNAAEQRVLIASEAGSGTPAESRITGQVVSVRPVDNLITVKVRGVRQTFRVDRDTIILRGPQGERGTAVELVELQPGDEARLRVNATSGTVEVVEAVSVGVARGTDPRPADEQAVGEVVSVRRTGNRQTITVRTETGRVSYDVAPDTALLRDGARVRLDEIEPGDQVRVRADARSGAATRVEITGGARPAPNVPVVPERDLRVTSFGHDATGMLRAGAEVRVTMVGPPGGIATFDVGGLRRDIPMREDQQRPGRYLGTYTVPQGITAKEVPIIGQVTVGGRAAPLIQSGTPLNLDSEPPAVTEVAPGTKSVVQNAQPDIYAEISDGAGSGVDRASMRMFVGGRDVTSRVKVTPRFLLYSPDRPLPPGEVPVSVVVKDLAGNETEANWSFTVRPMAAGIQSVAHDADRPLRVGETITVTVQAPAGGGATFSLGDVARDIPMRETVPGTYVGRYRVRAADRGAKAPVVVDYVTPGGQRVRQQATAPVNLLTQELRPPTITSPTRPAEAGEGMVVTGTGTPGSKVMVQVSYTGSALGFLPVSGTLGSQEATVDRIGNWKTEPFKGRLPAGLRRPEYTIRAVGVDSAGEESTPTIVTLRARQ